jgi:hypothetical protein
VSSILSSSSERAEDYRRLAGRLRGLSKRAALPEARAELLWLAQSYERLAHESDGGLLMDGYSPLERAGNENLDRAVPD